MQVLKEEVKEALLKAAVEEFYDKGYEKTSLRKVIKDAGTTIGNFYNYFKSKEELFYAITTPAYVKFVYLIKNHNDQEHFQQVKDIDSDALRQLIAYSLNGIDKDLEKALLILIDGSKGTKYENIKEEIVGFIAEHFLEHIGIFSENTDLEYYKKFAHITAVSFVEGFLDILHESYIREEKVRLITDYVLFYMFGSESFLE